MRPDCLILNAGAVTAGASNSGSGTLTARARYFHITRIDSEVPVLLDFNTDGEDLDAQGNGFYVPEDGNGGGKLMLPVPFTIVGAAAFSWVITALQDNLTANNGRVSLIGYWSDGIA